MDGYNTIGRNMSLFSLFDINTLKNVPRRYIKIQPGLTVINGKK